MRQVAISLFALGALALPLNACSVGTPEGSNNANGAHASGKAPTVVLHISSDEQVEARQLKGAEIKNALHGSSLTPSDETISNYYEEFSPHYTWTFSAENRPRTGKYEIFDERYCVSGSRGNFCYELYRSDDGQMFRRLQSSEYPDYFAERVVIRKERVNGD
jgi:hypothetical protein